MGLPKIDRLSWKLGACVAVIVIGGMALGFVLVYRHSYDHLLAAARDNASIETLLIRQALEHQMQHKDRQLIRRMVKSFAKDRSVRRVMVLDRTGLVRHTSDPSIHRRHFDASSPTCQECHRQPASRRSRSIMLEVNGGSVLRCVQPIPNRKACHACHDPTHRINGLIIVDVTLSQSLETLERSIWQLGLGVGMIGLVLLGGIGLVFRRLVLRRLFRFEAAARAIAEGRLDRRVTVSNRADALTRVEEQFNRMADSVTGLLERLREQRASLEKVMNSVDDGMIVLDRDFRVVAVNEALVRRFPDAPRQLIGLGCCDERGGVGLGCAREERSTGECPTARCFATGAVHTEIRTRRASDGSLRQEEVQASPVHAEQGAISHVVEVWRDITDRRSSEARLAESQRMISLGVLASGFSHEVNTPLASIKTCLDGIKRVSGAGEGADVAQLAEYARIASTQVARCGDITQQFLKLARGQTLAQEIIDLAACAELVVGLSRHPARDAGVSLKLVASDQLPAVLANEAAVQQVLLNLTLNAIEASPRCGEVTISFADGEQLEVRIQDRGPGIAPEDRSRVFEPFFTRKPTGTGLGLFVSANLARSWGGEIQVESTLGEGTSFTVVFPRDKPEGQVNG